MHYNWQRKIHKYVNDHEINPFPNEIIFDSSKLKVFAEDNFKFDENGQRVLQMGRKQWKKGEIAHYEQFLLFPQCFLKNCTADT